MTRQATIFPAEFDHLKATANNDFNAIEYLAVDPGKWNGVCGYDAKFYLQFMHVVDADDMTMFLECFEKIKVFVAEDYRLFPNKLQQQIYSKIETLRVLGRIESFTTRNKAELVLQIPSIKPTGYKWIGKKPPSKSSNRNDPMDAHVHFMYWAVKTGKINAADLLNPHPNGHTGPK